MNEVTLESYLSDLESYLSDLERQVNELRDCLKREDYGMMIEKYPKILTTLNGTAPLSTDAKMMIEKYPEILTTLAEMQYETHYADMNDRYPD